MLLSSGAAFCCSIVNQYHNHEGGTRVRLVLPIPNQGRLYQFLSLRRTPNSRDKEEGSGQPRERTLECPSPERSVPKLPRRKSTKLSFVGLLYTLVCIYNGLLKHTHTKLVKIHIFIAPFHNLYIMVNLKTTRLKIHPGMGGMEGKITCLLVKHKFQYGSHVNKTPTGGKLLQFHWS